MKIGAVQNLSNYFVPGILKSKNTEPEKPAFDPKSLGPKEVYLSWEAVSRASVASFNPKLLRTLMSVGVVIALLLVLMQDFGLIFIVASLIFVIMVLSKTAPELSKYEISNHGLRINDETYYWHELKNTFFMINPLHTVLVADTKLGIPSRIFITCVGVDLSAVQDACKKHIDFLEKEPKTPVDRFFEMVFSKFNITQQN